MEVLAKALAVLGFLVGAFLLFVLLNLYARGPRP